MLGGNFTHDIVRRIWRRPVIEEESIQVPKQNAKFGSDSYAFGVFRDILEHLVHGAEAKVCRTRVRAKMLRASMEYQRTVSVQRHSIDCGEIDLKVVEANISLHRS